MELYYEIEKNLISEGKIVAGIDEVGRGSLVGPVVSCAFVLNSLNQKIKINDSKLLSKNKRAHKFIELINCKPIFGLGFSNNHEIDELNILNATKLAMRRAVENLKTTPDILLIDGNQKIGTEYDELPIIKGDQQCKSIGAASIIAKITRDFLLKKISEIFPFYNLKQNMGYGTKEHIRLIKRFGICPFHRKTFKIN